MKLCLISDTHGDFDSIDSLIEKIKGNIDSVIHLGDDSTDANILVEKEFKVIKVPGVFEPTYHNITTSRRRIEEFEGIKFLLTHTPRKHENDFPDEEGPEELSKKVNVVLYGHTHIPSIETRENVVWINPGHMKRQDKRGFPPTYCILEFSSNDKKDKVINANIIELSSNNSIIEKTLKL
ncbi:MAG: metallophosphoesterase family protein [Endomicrobiales bacterium]|nr:metallophosphoesterase family protein [Endomicrobiales bacterium]